MAGVLAANDAMPNGSDEDELNGLLKGLLLFSGMGEAFFIICSLGGKAGGGANWTTEAGGGAGVGVDVVVNVGAGVLGMDEKDSSALGSKSSSLKPASSKLSKVMPPKSICEEVDSSKQINSLDWLLVVDEDTWLEEDENERCNESDSVLSFLSSPPFDRLPALEELLEMLVSTVHNSAICKKKYKKLLEI